MKKMDSKKEKIKRFKFVNGSLEKDEQNDTQASRWQTNRDSREGKK